MSAIVGILNHHGQPVDQCELQEMVKTMPYRGPDGQNFWTQGSTGLGHSMFRTTPESLHEILPFQDSESGLVITADARIDNREELAKYLNLNRLLAKDLPDSQFILLAYKKWADKCVNYLLGDFSFAIWSERDKRLFCARDHMGVKPFNYYTGHDSFVFATEVQAILEAPNVPKKLNEARIADFLVPELEGIDKTLTFFERIYRLPPAHTILVVNGNVTIQRYWEPDSEKRIALESDEDYVAAFTEIYTDSIKKRLRGNGNVASMLSGGIDSSSIVGIARDLHFSTTGQPFPVFSAISPEYEQDCRESYFINSVLNQGGLLPHNISIDDLDSLNEGIDKVVREMHEPFDPMIIIIAIYLMAKKSNYRVILDGIDGDIIASLSPSYPSILLKNWEYKNAFNAMLQQSKNYYAGQRSTSNVLYQNIRNTYTPMFLKKLKWAWQKNTYIRPPDESLINEGFAKKTYLSARLAQLRAYDRDGSRQSTHALHAKTIMQPYLTAGIERYDRVAALCGIEPRHPLLDKRVIEFMLGIPYNQKVRNGWSKYLLRRTSESFLNQETCWRRERQHLGGGFGRKWVQINLSTIITNIQKKPEYTDYYLNSTRLDAILNVYANKKFDAISAPLNLLEEDFLQASQLITWLENKGNL